MVHLKLITQFLIVLLVSALPASLFAAENSQVHPIGYSEQGRYFAYEEYGFSETDRAAYSKIYIIDLVQISQVVGTPILYQGRNSSQTLVDVRKEAQNFAQAFLSNLQFDTQAITIALNGDGQLGVDRRALSFGVPIYGDSRRTAGQYNITLDSFETSAASECSKFTDKPPLGFNLIVENFGASREVYTDSILARSRECPIHYELHSVVLPFGATDISKSVGIVSVVTQGPEGQNRHYIAIPLAFSI